MSSPNSTLPYSWLPRNSSDFNWEKSDCEIAAKFFRAIKQPEVQDYPVTATVQFLTSGLSQYWDTHDIESPDTFELLQWFNSTTGSPSSSQWPIQNSTLDKMLSFTLSDDCKKDFCNSLPYKGTEDQAGRGMIATYWVEAILVTLYITFIAFDRVRRSWSQRRVKKQTPVVEFELPPKEPGLHSIHGATLSSLRPFHDAALLFAFSMHIAAINTFARPYVHKEEPVTWSEGVNSAFAPLFSIFPAVTLHLSSHVDLRRKWFRKVSWIVISILALSVFVLYICSYSNVSSWPWDNPYLNKELKAPREDIQPETFLSIERERLCYPPDSVLFLTLFYFATFILLCSGWLVDVLLTTTFACIRKFRFGETHHFIQRLEKMLLVASTFASFLLMWIALIMFTIIREEKKREMGKTDDNIWTFGQILSLATFAPIFIEFIIAYNRGPRRSLTEQLPKGWEAIPTPPEMEQQQEKTQILHVGSTEAV